MKQVNAAETTAAALKRSATLAVGLLVALCAISVATSIVAMRASVSVTKLAVLSNEQRQIWTQIGRLVQYRPPPQTDNSVAIALFANLRKDTKRLLERSHAVEAEIVGMIDAPLKLVLLCHTAADWDFMRVNANVAVDLQRKFAALSEYPDDVLALGMETWGSDMQVAIASGTYLKPLNWLSDHTAELSAAVQRRTTLGLATINLALIAGSIIGWRRILIPTYRQWERGQIELLQTTAQVMERSAQFQGAFRAITDAACLLDDSGYIIAVNYEFSRLFKVSAQEASGTSIQHAIRQAADKDGKRITVDANTAQRMADQDLVATLDGRTVRLADESTIVIRLSKAGPDSWLFVAQIQGEAERNLTKKLHDEHLRQIGVYTAGVAHDLNNILGTISGRLQMFRASPTAQGNMSEFVRKLEATVLRGVALVSDLTKFSRSASLQPVLLSAAELERELISSTVVGENISFKVIRTDDFVVHVDPRQLVGALENICKNSMDAIGDRPGTLSIELRRARSGAPGKRSGYACITVLDSGGGFSQAALDRAFDPFYSTKMFGRGTGLGLAIVKSFVEESGGDIQIRNTTIGACVEIFLPAIDTDRTLPK